MVREPFKYLDLEKMKGARSKLFYHFYLFSIASIIIILFIAGLGLYYALRDLVIQEAQISAIRISTAVRDCEIRRYIGQHYNTNERFLTIPSEELPEVDHHMRVFVTPFDIVKINIFNTEPRVIYSTDSKTIGELALDNVLLLSALTGIPNSKYVSKRQVWDSADKEWKSIAIVETHVPMYGTDGKIIGSFEIQKDITRNLTMTGKIFVRS